MWAVEHRESGEFLGMTGFSPPPGSPVFELAWRFARRFWGHDYATESARAAMDYAFRLEERNDLVSLIHPENRASIRLAERLGEVLLGEMDLGGGPQLRYGIDRESYLRLPAAAA